MFNSNELLEAVKDQDRHYIDPKDLNPIYSLYKLENVDSLSDHELEGIIDSFYSTIISRIVQKNSKDNSLLKTLFQNSRFVSIFVDILSKKNITDHSVIINLNKIIYDYNTQSNNFMKDEKICSLLIELSDIINLDYVVRLNNLGLPKHLVSSLANASKSSDNINSTVKRVDLILFNFKDTEVLTEQNLVDIYAILFGDNLTDAFEALLLDVYPSEMLQLSSSDSTEIYHRINLAMIDIIEYLPPNSIQFILKQYNLLRQIHGRDKLRFDFNLSADYVRINQEIYNLRVLNNIYIV